MQVVIATNMPMTRTPAISICIPAYDMGGDGARFLSESFQRLKAQSFKDFEVVVSDQSETHAVQDACHQFDDDMDIRWVDNRSGRRQSSANANNAIRHARGRVVKILFQDDFLCHSDALQELARAFEAPSCKWVLMGSGVTYDGIKVEAPMVPRWHDQIRFGRNTISSPSVLAFEAGHDLFFDEGLIWLMDVDFYHGCFKTLGAPVILPDTFVANRLHPRQVSQRVGRALRRRELRKVARKYGMPNGLPDLRTMVYQYLKALG